MITPPVEGRGLDIEAAVQLLIGAAAPAGPTTLALPVAEHIQPRLNAEVLESARLQAEALLATPVLLRGEDLDLTYDAATIGSWLTGDKAYNDYTVEDILHDAERELLPMRKKNSLRPLPPYFQYLQASVRKLVETTGSLIERLLPKSIHAVTARGFELKVALFVLACSINFLW